jgi:hypothetical protein
LSSTDRHHPGIVIAINPESVIGMPGTLIGIVRNHHQAVFQEHYPFRPVTEHKIERYGLLDTPE